MIPHIHIILMLYLRFRVRNGAHLRFSVFWPTRSPRTTVSQTLQVTINVFLYANRLLDACFWLDCSAYTMLQL
jgi:hypothetical protein